MFMPFLMANSPAPFPTSAEYYDINVAYSFVGKEDNDYLYDLTITNTGNEYALISQYLGANYSGIYGTIECDAFRNECLAPNQTKTYKYVADGNFDNIVNEEITWHTYYYSIKENNITWSNVSIQKGSSYYVIKGDFKNVGDYYYSSIVELVYQDETYYIDARYSDKSLRLYVEQDINPNNIEIKNITFYQSSYQTYKGGMYLAYAIYIFLGLLILGIFVIPPAIIIPISVVSYKRKKHNNVSE